MVGAAALAISALSAPATLAPARSCASAWVPRAASGPSQGAHLVVERDFLPG